MPNLVIVAIPREDDPVWKYSSEKKPHCTLLFLGEDQSKSMDIAAFLQHAVTIWDRGPFGLSVDYRGTLGADEADVLFFKKDWSSKALAAFRSTLLKDKNIRDAYDSTTQFPEWNPHLTMGYPTSPAKKDDRDYPGFHWVEFDRIALWTGDFEGPEFRLEYNYDREMEVMMTAAEKAVADVLEHHGVKGMKWGVRKARDVGGSAAKGVAGGARKVNTSRKDAKFRRQRNSGRTVIALVNTAALNTKANDLPRINAKYKGKARTSNDVKVFNTSRVPAQKAYRNEVAQAYRKNLEKAANGMVNASGTRRYEIRDKVGAKKGAPVRWKVRTRKIEHAGLAPVDLPDEFTVEPVFDKDGYITDIKLVEDDAVAQGEDFMEDFLAHHGVKGMKWGVRRDRHQGTATVTSRTNAGVTGRTRVKATQGGGQHAHEDALKVAGKKAVLKKSGTAALSNKDLNDIIERSRLETQARQATASTGKKFIKKKLGTQLDSETNRVINEQVRKHATGRK